MPFEAARPVDTSPNFWTPDRSPDFLPEAAMARFEAIKQRTDDTYALMVPSETMREVHAAKAAHERRIAELTKHPGLGGKGLPEDHPSVIDARKKLDKAVAELKRATELNDIRSNRWRAAGQTARAVEQYLQGGIPGGTRIVEFEDPPISELLKKGETIAAAVERVQHRVRELKADAHRVRSSCYTRPEAKALVRKAVDTWASNAIDCSLAIEHLQPPAIPTKTVQALVHNVPNAEGAVVFIEMPDVLGIFASVFRDQLTAWLDADVDRNADDANALDERKRAELEAEINNHIVAAERIEAALIFAGHRDGANVEFRPDCSPQALLGIRLVATPNEPIISGSSPEWASRPIR
jgi:hypothetical protein